MMVVGIANIESHIICRFHSRYRKWKTFYVSCTYVSSKIGI